MEEKPERWNQELYEKLSFEYLIECAENKKIDEWNALYLEYLESEWKRMYPKRGWGQKEILELVDIFSQYKRSDFSGEDFCEAISRGASFELAHLEGANFMDAKLNRANFVEAHLEGAIMMDAHLEKAIFSGSHLELAHLEGAIMMDAHLNGSHFEGAHFMDANLNGVNFLDVNVVGADFWGAHLEGAQFTYTIVDGGTMFTNNHIDKNTDFTGTALSATRIDPNLRTKLERNIREIQWKQWYDKAKVSPVRFLKKLTGKIEVSEVDEKEKECNPSLTDRVLINQFVKLFWWVSNYGSSTKRVIGVFFAWNILWAFIYQFLLPLQSSPILAGTNTTVLHTPDIFTAILQTNLMVFSITDLATEGLAYPAFICVTVHIVIGYFILAALITRLGIMFQNLSP